MQLNLNRTQDKKKLRRSPASAPPASREHAKQRQESHPLAAAGSGAATADARGRHPGLGGLEAHGQR